MIKVHIHCLDCGENFKSPFDDAELSSHVTQHEPLGMEVRVNNECPHCGKEIKN